MTLKCVDGVQQRATGTGTGPLVLGNATSAKTRRMQDAGISNGDATYVRIQHATIDAEWEIVKAVYSAETGQITRIFDAASSSYTGTFGAGGSLVSFSVGDKIVSGVYPARITAPDFPITITANHTAVVNTMLRPDTTAVPITVSLPANPAAGDEVWFEAPNDSWTTNTLTVDPGDEEIEEFDGSVEFMTPDDFVFRFNGTTWRLI